MIISSLKSVVEGYIFPNNIFRSQQQTHNRMNPHLKKIDNKEFSLFPEKIIYMITCTNVKMNVYNEKNSYDLIADDKGVNNS